MIYKVTVVWSFILGHSFKLAFILGISIDTIVAPPSHSLIVTIVAVTTITYIYCRHRHCHPPLSSFFFVVVFSPEGLG